MVLLRAICLCLVAIILLCGCTDGMAGEDTMNNTEINTETGGDTVVTPIEDIVLAENGEAKYTIIYDVKSEDDVAVATYLRLKLRELTGISFKLVDHSQKDTDCEILVGSTVSRNQTEEIFAKLDQRKACAVAVSGDKVCVVGGERSYSVVAVMKFLNEIKWEAANKRLTLRGDLNYFSSTDKVYLEELMVTEEYVDVYQTIFGTYSTYREQRYDLLKTADKKDQILIEALIERMGNSAAFYEGSSSLLNTGYIRKLDTSDYSRAAKVINGELLIPKQFAESYFGKTLAADSDGYVNITALCNGSEEYSLYRGGKLYIVTPKAVEGFSDTAATVNGYTNAEYVSRMIEFFTTSETPEPNNNTEQTRVVIAHKPFPENLADWSIVPYDSLYTPCVLSVKENGIDTIYLCYEVNTAIGAFTGYGNKGNPKTYITKSVDGGKTWEAVCEINGMTYGQLMSVNDNIYVMGQNANNIACIAKLDSSRTSGYQIALLHSNISTTGGGPGTVVEKDGKIYRPYNASVYIADVGSDLMNQASWTLSKSARDYFNNDWVKKVIGKVPDIARLIRFKEAIEHYGYPNEVLCFPHQVRYVKNYLGSHYTVKVIDIETIEKKFGIGKDKNESK